MIGFNPTISKTILIPLTLPVGLCGVLTTISLVLEEKAAATSSLSKCQSGACRGSTTALAPARSTIGTYESYSGVNRITWSDGVNWRSRC